MKFLQGQPRDAGMYFCKVADDFGDADFIQLTRMGGKWFWPNRDAIYTGTVIGHIGPIDKDSPSKSAPLCLDFSELRSLIRECQIGHPKTANAYNNLHSTLAKCYGMLNLMKQIIEYQMPQQPEDDDL